MREPSPPSNRSASAADRAGAAVWGHLVGDALGLPYEGLPPRAIPSPAVPAHPSPTDWSDDGALMLAQLDTLLSDGCDPAGFGRRAVSWLNDGAYASSGQPAFGIGRTTLHALRRVAAGEQAERAGGARESDNGNGSLMRILPVALLSDADTPQARLIQCAQRLSMVTHRHPRAQVACAAFVLIVHRVLWSDALGTAPDPGAALAVLASYHADTGMDAHLLEVAAIGEWSSRTGTGYVVDSFWSAVEAAAASTSYIDAIERAIQLGNDTDTTAAIAGGLAGAMWGSASIPASALASLHGSDTAERLVNELKTRLEVQRSDVG